MNEYVQAKDHSALAQMWLQYKHDEEIARQARIAIEEQLCECIGVKEEGTTGYENDHYKIKTVGKITRSVDTEAVQNHWQQLPQEIQQCFKWSASLDTKNYRALLQMRADLTPQLHQFIVSKPAKPSVSVELKTA